MIRPAVAGNVINTDAAGEAELDAPMHGIGHGAACIGIADGIPVLGVSGSGQKKAESRQ